MYKLSQTARDPLSNQEVDSAIEQVCKDYDVALKKQIAYGDLIHCRRINGMTLAELLVIVRKQASGLDTSVFSALDKFIALIEKVGRD